MKMLSTLTWIWKTFLSAQKDCYISFPTWVWRRVRPRIQRICPDLTSGDVETLVLWQTTTNRFRGILKIKQLPANHWVVGVMTGMVGVAGKEKDENESSTFFSTWPALESLNKMNMILLLFFILACSHCKLFSPGCRVVQMRGEWLWRMCSHPGANTRLDKWTVLPFLCAFKKAGLGSSQDATCFKGITRQRWVANG